VGGKVFVSWPGCLLETIAGESVSSFQRNCEACSVMVEMGVILRDVRLHIKYFCGPPCLDVSEKAKCFMTVSRGPANFTILYVMGQSSPCTKITQGCANALPDKDT